MGEHIKSSEYEFVERCRSSWSFYGDEWNGLQLEDADLRRSNYAGCVFRHCTFTDCDFRESSFSTVEFDHCTFIECNLNSVEMVSSAGYGLVFTNCSVSGLDLTCLQAQDLVIDGCFGLMDLSESEIAGAKVVRSVLRDVIFNGTDLSSVLFSHCDLTAAQFNRQTEMGDAVLIECNITDAALLDVLVFDPADQLRSCWVLPFREPGAIAESEGAQLTILGPPITAKTLGPRANLEIYGVDRGAKLYCSHVEEFRRFIR